MPLFDSKPTRETFRRQLPRKTAVCNVKTKRRKDTKTPADSSIRRHVCHFLHWFATVPFNTSEHTRAGEIPRVTDRNPGRRWMKRSHVCPLQRRRKFSRYRPQTGSYDENIIHDGTNQSRRNFSRYRRWTISYMATSHTTELRAREKSRVTDRKLGRRWMKTYHMTKFSQYRPHTSSYITIFHMTEPRASENFRYTDRKLGRTMTRYHMTSPQPAKFEISRSTDQETVRAMTQSHTTEPTRTGEIPRFTDREPVRTMITSHCGRNTKRALTTLHVKIRNERVSKLPAQWKYIHFSLVFSTGLPKNVSGRYCR